MTPQQIADTAARLGFNNVTLCADGHVTLDEEVWVLDDDNAHDEVWDRYLQIRTVLRANGLDLPFGCATLGCDHVFGTIVPFQP